MPRRLGRYLTGHIVDSVHDRSWDGLKHGALPKAAEAEYDVLVTADQNIPQQHLLNFKLRVLVLAGATNRLEDLVPLVPRLLERCAELHEGQVAVVSWRD